METNNGTWSEEAKKNSGWLILLGVIEIVAGVLAIASPAIAGGAIAVLVGIALLIGGVARLLGAFMANSFGAGALTFIWGLILAGTGFAFMVHPGLGLGALTLTLTVVLFVDGLTRIVISFNMKPVTGWGWMLICGILSILLAIMIWRQFPISGVWAIGTLVGFSLLFSGFTTVSVAGAVKKAVA